jgi:hypothetical protein
VLRKVAVQRKVVLRCGGDGGAAQRRFQVRRKVAVLRKVLLWRCARWRCSATSFYGVAQGGGAAQNRFMALRKVAVQRNVFFRWCARWRCSATCF